MKASVNVRRWKGQHKVIPHMHSDVIDRGGARRHKVMALLRLTLQSQMTFNPMTGP